MDGFLCICVHIFYLKWKYNNTIKNTTSSALAISERMIRIIWIINVQISKEKENKYTFKSVTSSLSWTTEYFFCLEKSVSISKHSNFICIHTDLTQPIKSLDLPYSNNSHSHLHTPYPHPYPVENLILCD